MALLKKKNNLDNNQVFEMPDVPLNQFLDVRNLEVIYTQGKEIVHAVNGVSFTLNKGETLGLVGETGAGKTTIAKSILHVLPDTSSKIKAGEIWFNGKDINRTTENDMYNIRGHKIAMIFQDPMTALNPLMTIGDQIKEVVLLHNEIDNKEAMDRVGDMLEMVGIPRERYVEYPHQFSGGMKQRVVIAMALACNPELLLADEPTTALDVTIQAQVLEMIKSLQQKLKTSMILITHDLGVVAETCDNVAVIYAGTVVEYGSKEDVFDHPLHPYTLGLFGSLPDMAKGEKRLHSIKGLPPDPTNIPQGCPFNPRCPHASKCCSSDQKTPYKEVSKGHYVRCYLEEKENE